MFANGCFVTDGNHRFDDPTEPVPWQGFTTKGPTRIGDNVWCGANVVVTSGVTIGERCVIGANSVVTTDLPAVLDRRRRARPRAQDDHLRRVTPRGYLLMMTVTPKTTTPRNASVATAPSAL